MTADAKIGLLLGLVFIFVIAFIINGLPNFGGRSQAADGAALNELQDDRIGVADSAQNAQEQLGWADLLDREGEEVDGLGLLDSDLGSTVSASASETVTATASETAGGGEIRNMYELPSIENLVEGVSRSFGSIVSELTETAASVVTSEQSSPSVSTPVATMSDPLIDVIPPVAQASEVEPEPQLEPAKSQNVVEVTDLIRRTAPKVYVVQEGDVLATVAKKVYGPEEGNRLANVKRIFEANSKSLKSPDEIFVGQKLVIPPLPKTTEKNDALSQALFEKVEAIGRRSVPAAPKPSGRSYVICEDDSLWKIAADQLGSGARWEEIAKLNGLAENSTLKIGSELKLPAK